MSCIDESISNILDALDMNNDDSITGAELHNFLSTTGKYYDGISIDHNATTDRSLLRASITSSLVDPDGDSLMNLEDMRALIEHLRKKNLFLSAEPSAIIELFTICDEDENEHLDVCELSKCMSYNYRTTVSDDLKRQILVNSPSTMPARNASNIPSTFQLSHNVSELDVHTLTSSSDQIRMQIIEYSAWNHACTHDSTSGGYSKYLKCIMDVGRPSLFKTDYCTMVKFLGADNRKDEVRLVCSKPEWLTREDKQNNNDGLAVIIVSAGFALWGNDASWATSDSCNSFCASQAEHSPRLKDDQAAFVRSKDPDKHKGQGDLYFYPHNMASKGTIVGTAPVCNSNIPGEDYCKEGCKVDGKQMPCTTLTTNPKSSPKSRDGFNLTPLKVPERLLTFPRIEYYHNTEPAAIKDEHAGCHWHYKYCCCVAAYARELIEVEGVADTLG